MTTKQPDWEAIERAYRAGLPSVRAMGEGVELNKRLATIHRTHDKAFLAPGRIPHQCIFSSVR